MRKVLISESQFDRLIMTEAVNEGWLKNTAMAGAMGFASMFGSQNADAQDFRRGLRDYYGDNQETAVRNLEKAGMQNIKKGENGAVYYVNGDGISNSYFARPNNLSDTLYALHPNKQLEKKLRRYEKEGKLQLNKFKKIENPAYSKNITLKDVYDVAKQSGFSKDDFILYMPNNDHTHVYILPNTDINNLISNNDNTFELSDFDIQ